MYNQCTCTNTINIIYPINYTGGSWCTVGRGGVVGLYLKNLLTYSKRERDKGYIIECTTLQHRIHTRVSC